MSNGHGYKQGESGAIYKAIIAVMREIGAIPKADDNKEQHYKYRSAADIYNRVQPLFAKYGIFSFPRVLEATRDTGKSKSGGHLHYVMLTVEYTFAAADGSAIAVTVVGEGMDSGDKASAKAMTMAHKCAICQVLNVPYAIVDPDANSPEWASRLTGSITLQQLNDLKKAWAAKHPEMIDLDRDAKRREFQTWVEHITGTLFDAADFRKWTAENHAACRSALSEPAAPPDEVAQYVEAVAKCSGLESCDEFITAVVPTIPEHLRDRVVVMVEGRRAELRGES